MSLKHGILGFLSQWPETTGYDLKKEFDTHMRLFWFTHLSQIYPELNKLEEQGLVQSQTVKQDAKPDKKTYTITKQGMAELVSWLQKPPAAPKVKDAFLMQAFFADKVPFDEVIFLIRSYQKKREERLQSMKGVVHSKLKEIRDHDSPVTARMMMGAVVYKKAIEEEEQYIRWCWETIQWLKDFAPLWTGEGTDWVELDHPETTGLTKVPALPFSQLEKKLSAYLGTEWIED